MAHLKKKVTSHDKVFFAREYEMIAKPRMEYDEVDVVFTTTIALHTYLGKRFQSSCELKRNLVRNVD